MERDINMSIGWASDMIGWACAHATIPNLGYATAYIASN